MSVPRGGLRTTLVLTLTAIMIAGVLLISVVIFRITEQLLVQESTRLARSLLQGALVQTEARLDPARSLRNSANLQPLQELARQLTRVDQIQGVYLLDGNGERLAGATTGDNPDPQALATAASGRTEELWLKGSDATSYLRVYAPIRLGGRPSGAVRLDVHVDSVRGRLEGARNLILFYLLVNVVVLLALGSYLLDRWLIRPLRLLTRATERVASGQLTHYVDVQREDELGRLARAFNQMVQRLALSRGEVESRIGDLERLNEQLQAAHHTMFRAEKLAGVGTLAAGVAHEVGNPLAAILGYLELLRREEQDEERRDMLRRMREQVLRIDGIIGDLLAYSRPATDAERRGSIANAIDTTIALIQPQPRLRDVAVEVKVPADLPLVAMAEARLQQILLNLLLNGADAMEGEGNMTIAATLREDDVDIEVTDDGGGITAEDLPRIFDPFFTTKEPGAGTGLGLAMVERLVQDHQGKVEVSSEPGCGTSFTVTLPRYREEG